MTINRFYPYIIAIIFKVLLIGSLGAQTQPNILIFLVDDLRPELGCYGNEIVKSPNIDKLSEQGITFDNAYCQQAICAPSRMSILTGKRVEKLGIYSIFTPFRSVHPDMLSMPQLFKQNGYKTVSIGKVYHHSRDDLDSWSIHIPKEPNTYAEAKNIAIIDSLKRVGSKSRNGPPWEAADVEDEGYKDGRATRDAIKTLNQIKDDPFLMMVGLSKPHLPFNAPKKYWDLYDQAQFEVPLKKTPLEASSYATTSWGELRNYYGMPESGFLGDDETRRLIHGYYACVSYIDAQVGKIMATLDELDLRQNTTVVFMSDHGYKIGEYGAWCKHTNFELDTNVPLIVSQPGGVAGVRSNGMVENIDVFPTIAEISALPLSDVDGKSLVPLLKDSKYKSDDGAYSVYARGSKIMGVTVTDGVWRYTEWRNVIEKSIHSTELYTCESDYSELAQNLSGQEAYSQVENRMKTLMAEQFPEDYAFPQNDMPRK